MVGASGTHKGRTPFRKGFAVAHALTYVYAVGRAVATAAAPLAALHYIILYNK